MSRTRARLAGFGRHRPPQAPSAVRAAEIIGISARHHQDAAVKHRLRRGFSRCLKSDPFPVDSGAVSDCNFCQDRNKRKCMRLTPIMERYVLHWGEMGARWGVNRSVAQIHALLYLAPQPLTAEEIADTLALARSNVSTSLRELQGWGLVSLTHVMGDRRDHFEAKTELWEMLLTIVEERKRREVDPTLTMLRQCVLDAEDDKETAPEIKARIERMLTFLETLANWYVQMRTLQKSTLVSLMKMGAKVAKVLKLTKAA
jgi:DNA-binding transcriptional regulator GbsR (MarR family)